MLTYYIQKDFLDTFTKYEVAFLYIKLTHKVILIHLLVNIYSVYTKHLQITFLLKIQFEKFNYDALSGSDVRSL